MLIFDDGNLEKYLRNVATSPFVSFVLYVYDQWLWLFFRKKMAEDDLLIDKHAKFLLRTLKILPGSSGWKQ